MEMKDIMAKTKRTILPGRCLMDVMVIDFFGLDVMMVASWCWRKEGRGGGGCFEKANAAQLRLIRL